MATQSEKQLEDNLIAQLQRLGWERIVVADEDALINNFKKQLEIQNNTQLSDVEFKQVLNKVSKGNVFDKAKILREMLDFKRDDGTTGYIELINNVHWCKNQFQVTNQITMVGKYKNRYDVTLLINGLPLCQIELKRRGLEMKEAFNQINRYERHSYSAGYKLFNYIQLFVISNGVNTKYLANNPNKKSDYKQTFFWAQNNNHIISGLSDFAEIFLEKCHLAKMITKYIVRNESDKKMMVLRPYQFYAVESIVERVINTNENGYIWHTTGSGKTLTSFKAAQIIMQNPKVHKVVFVVDRKDLDYQTIREFNSFKKDSVDSTTNTAKLVEQFQDDTPLIVTTLQKLNNAIHNKRHLAKMEELKNKKMVFIFDECHRSQFGETHQRIVDFFDNVQMFGFTGTPIFAENAVGSAHQQRTTKDLFNKCLHKYIITDAIRDENVLKFSVDYVRTLKIKENIDDVEVEGIDSAEVMESPRRLETIVDYIIANHKTKTGAGEFNAIFCVSNIKSLITYYELFKNKKEQGEHKLKIATIFSYQANEEDADADGMGAGDDLPDDTKPVNKHSREKLDEFIDDYNTMLSTNFSTDTFYDYYRDIGKKVKEKKIDILLVVNMFLTGFDSKRLNTIYVDKNLKFHGLLQAYSRTNRTMGQRKSQGNVVCFRDLKPATDEAIILFADREAQEDIILAPYEEYVKRLNEALSTLFAITPDASCVDKLLTEEDEVRFIQAFREIIRIKNVLDSFTQFSFDDVDIDEQLFIDFKSKYLDLYDKARSDNEGEKTSILDDIDFEIELISRDKINISYIIDLLQNMAEAKPSDRARHRKAIIDILDAEVHLRSKKELIENFIEKHFFNVPADSSVREAFESYWDDERQKELEALSKNEGLHLEGLKKIMDNYFFTQKFPMRDGIIDILKERPTLRERSSTAERVMMKIQRFLEIFIDGMD